MATTDGHGEEDLMQDCGNAAYACDGEPDSRFEQLLNGLAERHSPLEIAVLSSCFLNRGMTEQARFLAWLAGFIWSGSIEDGDVVKRWRGRQRHRARATEESPYDIMLDAIRGRRRRGAEIDKLAKDYGATASLIRYICNEGPPTEFFEGE